MPITDLSSPVLAYMLGNIAAGRRGTVPGRAVALAAELHSRGDLDRLLDELDPDLATALRFLLSVDHGRARYPKAPRPALNNADTSGS